jgi:hypothetical protein
MVINGTDLRIWIDDVLVANAISHSLSIKMGSRKATTKDTNRFGRAASRRLEVTGTSENLLVYGNFESIISAMNKREAVKMDFGNISSENNDLDITKTYATGNFLISSFDKNDPDDENSNYTINFEHYSGFEIIPTSTFYPELTEPCWTNLTDHALVSYAETLSRFVGESTDNPFYISMFINIQTNGYSYLVNRSREYDVYTLGGKLYFSIYSDGGNSVYLCARSYNNDVATILGSWHHLLFTYDGSKAYSGIKIYIDGAAIQTTNQGAGSYNRMQPFGTNVAFGATTNGMLSDLRIGSAILTESDIINLFNHEVLGSEIFHIPLTEGYGLVMHNVTTNINLQGNLFQYGAGDCWENTQSIYRYNYNFGAVKINNYIFPNLNNKTVYFKPIFGYVLAGQSNASSNYGHTDDLVGGKYSAMDTAGHTLTKTLGYYSSTWKNYNNPDNYCPYFGLDAILLFNNNSENKETFIIQRGIASTGLYPGSSAVDWHPDTVGEHFDLLAAQISTDLMDLFTNGREPFIKSFVWVHGELDSGNTTYADAYYSNLVAFFNKWKTLISDSLNIQITELNPNTYTGTNRDTIRTAQHNFVANYGNANIIETDDATVMDGQHYDSATLVRIAEEIYNNVKYFEPPLASSYLNKIFPGYTKIVYIPHN